MNNLVRVEIFERIPDLLDDRPGHAFGKGFEVVECQVLLQVTIRHILHYDACLVLDCELLLKANNIGTVFAASLQLNFPVDLRTLLRIEGNLRRMNRLDGKQLARAPVLAEHH